MSLPTNTSNSTPAQDLLEQAKLYQQEYQQFVIEQDVIFKEFNPERENSNPSPTTSSSFDVKVADSKQEASQQQNSGSGSSGSNQLLFPNSN
uniref:Uncharacterized protein n=1 Tax=Chromera velia CCMP2878 TaxID=1169474 RepID=A0A0G4FMK7_9ALVE|eukprot:Cvel_17800.t1-p1 / transcript=Cvel_17800.t1 / gene=Cvel_17800 / organism=Chromera_velia_CCMP2878 / gene_product=hypothetical protein / transcript_product=hypothetical protein / location=Cvel_scaffold1441:38327-38904(-) / protein_length=91 / sequence_SO=supercontig / SO=protein_coding / is_pseudo=false